MYVVNLRNAVYVLHAFIKKSNSGIAIPKTDANVIRLRAQGDDAEDDNA